MTAYLPDNYSFIVLLPFIFENVLLFAYIYNLRVFSGLGTLYDDVEPPVTYGLSHTYGAMSDYGPFGVYSRPKRPDQPYIPPKNVQETILPLEPNNKYCKFCNDRLRGGGPWPGQPFLLLENATEVNKKCLRRISSNVLRLRGGGPCPERPVALLRTTSKNSNVIKISKPAQRQSDTPRLRGGGPLDGEGLKSPIKECKEVMDKFDEILTAYKKALGPCGQATCPNAPSLAQEKCKSVCGKGETIPPSKDEGRLCDMPCDFGGGFPACRDPKCAYAKYKLGNVSIPF